MGNQLRHILIIFSILLLSSPGIGQSSKYESVSQCVLQTMEDRKLTGNKMFEMVKEECERILGNVHKPELEQNKGKKNGVLYYSKVDGNWGWNRSGNEKKDIKYVGEIENGNPNGQGTVTYANGNKYVGKWKDGKYNGQGTLTLSNGLTFVGIFKYGEEWNGNGFNTKNKIIYRFVNGERKNQ